jgi:predicted Zn-dependent protease with MMP-like domain
VNDREFEELVAEALDSLPEEFLRHLENIEVTIEDWPSGEELAEAGFDGHDRRDRYRLLGLYVGIPLTERGGYYGGVLPDRIVLYQKPIEAAAGGQPETVKHEVRHTVIHEIAHFYGIDDDRLEELGKY